MRSALLRATTAVAVLALLLAAAPIARADLIPDKIDPALRARMQADPLTLLPVIVEMQPPSFPFVGAPGVARANEALDLLRLNGRAAGGLPLIQSAAGFANATGITAMSLVTTVAYIHHDATVGPRLSLASPTIVPPNQLSTVYPRVINADQLWAQGTNGRGVTVAVLDSGVAADVDLTAPTNRLLASVNFADERLTNDPGGHGTHIAGTIAGNGTRSAGQFVGVAPGANIVDVRVLNAVGSGRISSLVRGIEWVVTHRSTYNIRVINLSFGAPASTSYRTDPLSAAVEVAWRLGIVVVAAAGNSGPGRDTTASPGIDPYAITVGATDDIGTLSRRDDVLAWFSSWGSADGNAKPDLVAPGRRIVAPRVPGSALDTLFPDRVVTARNGSTYFRLTGTSMATAVVSGAVALLLQRRPDLGPDDVKALLVGQTQTYGQDSGMAPPDPIATGSGLLDAYAAVSAGTVPPPSGTSTTTPAIVQLPALGGLPLGGAPLATPPILPPPPQLPPPANRGLRQADGFARSAFAVLYGLPLVWRDPTLGGIAWQTLTWDSVVWDSVAWDNFDWDSVAWDSVAWDSVAWDSVAWDSVAWDSVAWDSVAWDALNLD